MYAFIILIFTIFFTCISHAEDNNDYIHNLVVAYEDLVYSENAMPAIIELSGKVEALRNTPGFEVSDEWDLLQTHFHKGRNFYYLQRKMSGCAEEEKRNLNQRFLQQAGLFNIDNFECEKKLDYLKIDTGKFITQLDDIAATVIEEDIYLGIREKLLGQAVESYFDHQDRYGLNVPFSLDAKRICDKVSKKSSRRCSLAFEEKLKEKLESSKNIKASNHFDEDLLEKELNEIIEGLNTEPEKFQEKLLTAPGSLLLSDKIQSEMGSLENIGKEKLSPIKKKVIKSAILNINSEHIAMIKDLGKDSLLRDRKDINKAIKKILISSPHLVGEKLMQTPEYASHICRLLGQINEDDEYSENLYKWGGRIAMGALAVGTVLTAGGLALVVGGVGAAYTGFLITAGTIGMGAAGVIGGSVAANKAIENYNNVEIFERSIMVGAADEESVNDIKNELEEFYKNRMEAAIALGSTIVPLHMLKYFKSFEQLKALNKFIGKVLSNSKIMQTLKAMKDKYGVESMQELFFHLSKMGFNKALDYIKRFKISYIHRSLIIQQKKFWRKINSPTDFVLKAPGEDLSGRQKVISYIINPIGSSSKDILINSKLRDHVSFAGQFGLMWYAGSEAQDYLSGKRNEWATSVSETTPGSSAYTGYKDLTDLSQDDINQGVLKHTNDIFDWLEKPFDSVLPRVASMVNLGIVKQDEVQRLNQLAKRAYELAKKEMSKNGGEKIDTYLKKHMKNLLNESEFFKDKSSIDKLILATFFNPEIPITENLTDLGVLNEIKIRSNTVVNDLVTDNDYKNLSLRLTIQAYNEGAINQEKALLLVGKILENPESIKSKYEKISKVFDDAGVSIEKSILVGLVPDRLGDKTASIFFNPKRDLKDEADKWEILLNDKRFESLKKDWIENNISSSQALTQLNLMIDTYNSVEIFHQKWTDGKNDDAEPTDIELKYLYNLTQDPDIKANPMLLEYGQMTADYLSASKNLNELSIEELRGKFNDCLRLTARHWAKYTHEEGSLALRDDFKGKRAELNDQYFVKYSEILKNCDAP